RNVERGNLRLRERLREHADDARAHGVVELVQAKVVVGACNLLQEQLRIDDLEIVDPEGTHPHDPEILVAHHDRVRRSPLVASEQARCDVIHIGLERALEPVLPALEIGEDRDVVRRERVLARAERIAELAEIHELGDLRFADDQLRAAFNLLVLVGKPEGERIARVIGPFDDVDELLADEVENGHIISLEYLGRSYFFAASFLASASPLLISLSSCAKGNAPGTTEPSAKTSVGV